MISNFNTAILQMEFSLNHQLMRNLGLYQGPILWAYWHQSFPRQVGGVWLRSMKNLKGSQPQRWIESSLGMLKNSHLFWPELSSLLIISYSWGFLRLKIMENSNHFVPREKLFIFEIASLHKMISTFGACCMWSSTGRLETHWEEGRTLGSLTSFQKYKILLNQQILLNEQIL